MRFNGFYLDNLRVPFRIKRLAVSGLMLFLLAATVAFASDVQQTGPDDVRQLRKQAQKLVRHGDLVQAEKLLRRAVEISPMSSPAKLDLAYVLVKERRLLEAYELSFDIAQKEPQNARAFAVLGATLLTAGNFKEARIVCVNAVKLNKKEGLAWAGLGMLDFYENRVNESIDRLSEAVFQSPDEADYWFALAQVSARAEKFKEAANAYNTFLLISRNTDDDRRARIRGLINFLKYLGERKSLYETVGSSETSVSFKLVGNRPVVQVKANDRDEPLNFVLDTGSGISVISEKTAKKLKIGSITKGGFAKGIGGDGRFEIVYGFLRSIGIGDVKIRSVPVYIRKFHSTSEGIDGYIGLSLISKFLTTIDYGDLTFSLVKRDSENRLTDDGSISLPLRLTSSGFLSGEVQLEGIEAPLNFIVDTGASVSVISDVVAKGAGISGFVTSEKMRVIGSAGITEDVPSFLLPRVSFGNHSRQKITAIALDLDMINEASGFEQAGILGGNFLRNYRLTFDFKNSKVIFVPLVPEAAVLPKEK
jgi:Flp pilus assembly protein TadD/predicted aspartyl protease